MEKWEKVATADVGGRRKIRGDARSEWERVDDALAREKREEAEALRGEEMAAGVKMIEGVGLWFAFY
jgi:hypothetical protein